MSFSKVITWVGVVSGVLTILFAFGNPFVAKPDLHAYISSSVAKAPPKSQTNQHSPFFDHDIYLTKIVLNNNGDKVANKIHIDFKNGYQSALMEYGNKRISYFDSSPIYLDSLEPEKTVTVYFWTTFPNLYSYDLNTRLVISSPDFGVAKLRSDIPGYGIIWYIYKYGIYILGFVIIFVVVSIQNLLSSENSKPDKSHDYFPSERLKALSHAWEIGLLTEKEFQEKGKLVVDEIVNRKVSNK